MALAAVCEEARFASVMSASVLAENDTLRTLRTDINQANAAVADTERKADEAKAAYHALATACRPWWRRIVDRLTGRARRDAARLDNLRIAMEAATHDSFVADVRRNTVNARLRQAEKRYGGEVAAHKAKWTAEVARLAPQRLPRWLPTI